MNERIRELAKQADDYADTYCDTIALSYSNWNAIRDTKFAELIVKECARVYWNIDQSETHTEYVNDLTEHFGVEK